MHENYFLKRTRFQSFGLAPNINTNALTSCQSMPYTYIIFQEESQSKCAPCAWWLFLPFRTNHRIAILWCRFWLLLDALTGFHFYTDWRWLHLCKFNIITTKGDNVYFSLENCVLIWGMDVLLVEWERVQAQLQFEQQQKTKIKMRAKSKQHCTFVGTYWAN